MGQIPLDQMKWFLQFGDCQMTWESNDKRFNFLLQLQYFNEKRRLTLRRVRERIKDKIVIHKGYLAANLKHFKAHIQFQTMQKHNLLMLSLIVVGRHSSLLRRKSNFLHKKYAEICISELWCSTSIDDNNRYEYYCFIQDEYKVTSFNRRKLNRCPDFALIITNLVSRFVWKYIYSNFVSLLSVGFCSIANLFIYFPDLFVGIRKWRSLSRFCWAWVQFSQVNLFNRNLFKILRN